MDPARRAQSADLPMGLRAARTRRRLERRGCGGDLGGHEAGVPVVTRPSGDPGADRGCGPGETAVMMVALLAVRPHRHRLTRQSENSLRVLVPQTLVLTKRMLLRWSRDLPTVLQTLIVPILLLVTLNTVLGRQITSISGHDALYGSVPMVAIVATISGSSVGALGLIRERADGLLARLWALPVHRASGLLSRFVAEAVRILVTSMVILAAGMARGFRFPRCG